MTKREKIDFFEAVYKCALGDSEKYAEMLDDFCCRGGGVTKEQAEILNIAFNCAKQDLQFEKEQLHELARSKAERYFE